MAVARPSPVIWVLACARARYPLCDVRFPGTISGERPALVNVSRPAVAPLIPAANFRRETVRAGLLLATPASTT